MSKHFDIEEALPLELTQKQLTQMLGCSTSTLSRYLKFKDFPKIDRGKGTSVKYPRDAVREWYNSHWREFSE
ncbi:helix-turn-helix transcriptional regulator [Streptococcus sanguinis]|uniref:helix-turn-helix transcriptional regulator n=1 Tax=Streptococcus sanguinis TaxID=1305 RepID=UPI001F484B5A|nr:helix-turn-helix domain-containing protein [Streptococcus sanguinis]